MLSHIIEELFAIGSLKVGKFILKSGQESPIYIDLRPIISHPALLREMSAVIWQVHQHSADFICGVPYTALPMATCISLSENIPMVMRRKEAKNYGTKKQIEGLFQPGQTCIIIEDIVTTGMSILETIKDLEAAGLRVVEVLSFLDREQGGAKNLENAGYPFHAAVTLTQVAEHLFQADLIDINFRDMILQICNPEAGIQN